MSDSIWTAPLATFRARLTGAEPIPAGVSAAAVSAVFGFGLLTKVLAIASKRKSFAGDPGLVNALIEEARNNSEKLSRLADDDIVAFQQYLDCLREKKSTDAAIRNAIEVPLNIARSAASGIPLCEQAEDLVHAAVKPDLEIARTLLGAAVHSTLFTVEANLEQLPSGDRYREEVTAEARQLLQQTRNV